MSLSSLPPAVTENAGNNKTLEIIIGKAFLAAEKTCTSPWVLSKAFSIDLTCELTLFRLCYKTSRCSHYLPHLDENTCSRCLHLQLQLLHLPYDWPRLALGSSGRATTNSADNCFRRLLLHLSILLHLLLRCCRLHSSCSSLLRRICNDCTLFALCAACVPKQSRPRSILH